MRRVPNPRIGEFDHRLRDARIGCMSWSMLGCVRGEGIASNPDPETQSPSICIYISRPRLARQAVSLTPPLHFNATYWGLTWEPSIDISHTSRPVSRETPASHRTSTTFVMSDQGLHKNHAPLGLFFSTLEKAIPSNTLTFQFQPVREEPWALRGD